MIYSWNEYTGAPFVSHLSQAHIHWKDDIRIAKENKRLRLAFRN